MHACGSDGDLNQAVRARSAGEAVAQGDGAGLVWGHLGEERLVDRPPDITYTPPPPNGCVSVRLSGLNEVGRPRLC
ncbi:hypothetical protein SSPO_003420 [Streptomyces antimycoticus]|uniref:Uncharacterized protein n=1 Tax=Streptomyces antimycoticus TaxID=68175 RepID=A0A499UA64_9ACTN|nr:hypothetical protein SSPO_003420 [Streptomyces antimycoticus]